MMPCNLNVLWVAVLGLFASSLAGCGQSAPRQDASPQSPAAAAAPVQPSPGPAASDAHAGPNSALSEADRKLIEQQKVCPVTDEPLGSMGEPVKVVVQGRTVFLCCDGCKETLLADPGKYLKKLDQKKE